MAQEQIVGVIGGLVAAVVGLWAIVTRRIAVGEDEHGEENSWVYGWRAVLIGCLALVASAVFFASAAGLVNLSSG